jgi:hypothetical protein
LEQGGLEEEEEEEDWEEEDEEDWEEEEEEEWEEEHQQQQQEEHHHQQQQQQQQQPAASHAVAQPTVCASATSLTLDLDPLRGSTSSSGGSSNNTSSSASDAGAAAAYCSELWRALPGLTDLEMVIPAGVELPSLAPLTGLTSLVLQLPDQQPAGAREQAGLAAAVSGMLQGAPGIQQLVLRVKRMEGGWEWLAQQVHQVLPGLQEQAVRFLLR